MLLRTLSRNRNWMKNLAPCALATVVLCGGLAGCRATGDMLGDERAQPQSSFQWVVQPDVRMPEPTAKFYVRYIDGAGSGIDLTDVIRGAVTARGYALTNSPKEADYQFIATLRHFDKAREFRGANQLGVDSLLIVGPLTGAAIGYSIGDSAEERIVGVGVGLGVGAVAEAAARNFSKVNEWDLVLDLEIGEKIDGGFTERNKARNASESTASTAIGVNATGYGGSNASSNEQTADFERAATHLRNKSRLLVAAYQMTMTREEARAEIMRRLPEVMRAAVP
jgi:Enterobacterial TraT complement resistance protein